MFMCSGIKKENKDIGSYFFLMFFICLLVVICAQNWLFLEYHLSEDISGETMYMVKVWETKDPFTPAYANSAEPLFSKPWPFFVVFYSITRNAIISAKCTLITTTLCLALALGVLLKKAGLERNCVYVGLAAYFGLMASGSYTVSDMLFRYYNTYSMYHVGLMLTLILLLNTDGSLPMRIWKIVMLAAISFYFGLCGAKVLLLFYLPVFVFDVFEAIYNSLERKKVSLHLLLSGTLAFVNFSGIILYYYLIIPHMMAVPASLQLVFSDGVFDSLGRALTSLMTAFGISPNGEALTSVAALVKLYMFALLAVDLFGVIYLNKKDSIPQKARRLLCYAFFSICFTVLICTVSSYQGEPRYYLFVPLLTTLMVGLTYRYLHSRADARSLFALYCLFISVGFGLQYLYIYMPEQRTDSAKYVQLYEQLCEEDVDRFASLYTSGTSSVSLLSNGAIKGICFADNEQLSELEWINDRTVYSDSNITDGPFAIMLGNEDSEKWFGTERRGHLLSLASDVVSLDSGRILYKFPENYLAFDMLRYNANAKYNFLSLSYTENAHLDNGRIVLQKDSTQYGPYKPLSVGTYDVIIRGENLTAGTYDVFCGDHFLEMEDMTVGPEEVRYTLHVDQDLFTVEYRCTNTTDEPVVVRDIMVFPRGVAPVWA